MRPLHRDGDHRADPEQLGQAGGYGFLPGLATGKVDVGIHRKARRRGQVAQGGDFIAGQTDGLAQPMTLMFRMVEFNRKGFDGYVKEHPNQWRGVHGLWELVRKATEAGDLEMPREDVLYFGDTARGPYGWKSAKTVTAFVRQMLHFIRRFDPKHVVLACNTASALALPTLKAEFRDLSLSGVIDCSARAAIEAGGSKSHPVIAILAT